MTHNEISKAILDSAFAIHKAWGPGLLESIYRATLAYELRRRGFQVEIEVPIQAIWDGVPLGLAFKADLIVNNMVIVELKSIEALAAVHAKQLLTYLRLTDKRLGLLLNFGEEYLRDGIERVVNGLEE